MRGPGIRRYHRNEMSSVETLRNVSYVARNERASSHLLQGIVCIWYGCVECSACHKGDSLRLTLCVYHSWEITLSVGLDVSFDNMQDWKGKGESRGS
jgi:hypothetical protein